MSQTGFLKDCKRGGSLGYGLCVGVMDQTSGYDPTADLTFAQCVLKYRSVVDCR